MIGSTGVGKTEIARRLARLANAPFIKVEATKFTEVGYVGRDVESIIRDLAEMAVSSCKKNAKKEIEAKAHSAQTRKPAGALPQSTAAKGSKPLVSTTSPPNPAITPTPPSSSNTPASINTDIATPAK